MNSKLDSQIATWKEQVWQNQGIAQRYQVNIYNDSFVTTLKNLREIALAIQYSRGRVLDAGAGTGRFTIPLYDAGFDVTGLDISAEMLDVARQAAGVRPIPFIAGSVFELPYEAASFDTIVSITVVPHFPQWTDILREYARVLRPGGRMIFNMCSLPNVIWANRNGLRHGAMAHPKDPNYYQAEVDLPDVSAALARAGAVVTQIVPYDSFNHNYLLREALGTSNDTVMAELEHVFRWPGALELWAYVEQTVLPCLPITVSYGYLVIAEVPGDDGTQSTPWVPPPALELDGSSPEHRSSYLAQRGDPLRRAAPGESGRGSLSGALTTRVLRRMMGNPEFDAFYQGLQVRMQPEGAPKLIAALNELVGPYLPVPVDFMALLSPYHQARVLDQVAWRWAQGWYQRSPNGTFDRRGTAFAPLLEYEVLNHLTRVLRPLVGGDW
ncbi:MAG: class I SAM-dependent methyltransferase [Cyanobacteria bacterium NC_groundwater_1444_Ag_S-0.65um_54_12]|nr:class I SAM-dependent methyltransferase [Cyanobacteria bacterium NC_groundwater_1444_Ag_S-0.65um_54_12]